jgi:integrase
MLYVFCLQYEGTFWQDNGQKRKGAEMKATSGHLHKRGGRWYCAFQSDGKRHDVRIVDAAGQPVTNKGDARKLADELLRPYTLTTEAERMGALAAKADHARALADAANPGLALSETWQAYVDASNRPDTGPATMRQYRFQWGAFADWMRKHHADAKHLADVTPTIAQSFIAGLDKAKRSARTLNGYANFLHMVFRVLAEPGRVRVNPWGEQYITRRTLPKDTGRKEMSVDVLRKVCEAADGELRTLFAVGLYCGLRLGDACRLTWEEVDLARGVAVVTPGKTSRTSGATVAIPISPALRRVLEGMPGKRTGYIMPGIAADYAKHQRELVARIQAHFQACGLETNATVPGRARPRVVYGFHSMRHSFCSHAAAAGWPESLVRAIVGHSSAAVSRRYLHTSVIATGSLPALPDVLTPTGPALPAPAPVNWKAEVRRIAETLPRGAAKQRAALLEIAAD